MREGGRMIGNIDSSKRITFVLNGVNMDAVNFVDTLCTFKA